MLPFASNTFDTVVYNSPLHHMPEFKKAMNEAFTIIGPHGRIILYEPLALVYFQWQYIVY